jgi:diacylglycerol kinase (CTP)
MLNEFWSKLRALKLPSASLGLRHRSDLHLLRKGFHMSGALLILAPYLFLGVERERMAAVLGTLLAGAMSLEYARARWEWVNSLTVRFMGPIMRDTEVNQLSGIPFYLASCLCAFLIFPHHVAVLSILYLAFGDPFSSFFGVLYGRNKIFPNKSLQGTLGGFWVCALVTFLYLYWQRVDAEMLLIFTLLGGFAGSVAELLPLNVDDNFAIPVVSGALMALAFWCAQLPMAPL